MKECTKCKRTLPSDRFSNQKRRKDGLNPWCKDCVNEQSKSWYERNKERRLADVGAYYASNKDKYTEYKAAWRSRNRARSNSLGAHYRALKRQSTPPWADLNKIEQVYNKASQMGFHVDHIVPLTSDIVCGLHCWHNLQVLEPTLNISKSNRFWPDMPEE